MAIKTKINLYVDELKPKKEVLTLNLVAGTIAGVFLICLALGLYADYQLTNSNQQLNKLQQTLNQKQEGLQELQQALSSRKPDPVIVAKKVQLQKNLAARQNLKNYLLASQKQQSTSYAGLLTDLAKYHNKQVWLSRIRFDDEDQILLSGFSRTSAAVPIWLQGLNQSSYFVGKGFSSMVIQNDESGLHQFEIATQKQLSEMTESKQTNPGARGLR